MKHPKSRPHPERGFALIITISLMVLLSLLAVGLLSLSTVSLRTSSQLESRMTAQSNARLALTMALGQLQRELGPDSRISAPHDAGDSEGGAAHWTGAYDAWTMAPENERETPASRGEPELRGWMVSGGEERPGGEQIPILGASGGVGAAGAEAGVRVPVVEIDGSDEPGRLAWWVGDEGTKAKVNAGPDSAELADFGQSAPLFDSQSPPHPDHRMIPPLASLDWEDGLRSKVVSASSMPLAGQVERSALMEFTHDFTVHSAGLLTDVRAGRLKRDLSNLLSRSVSEVEEMPLYLADGRMNQFSISESGRVSNMRRIRPQWQSAQDTSDQWGINLEELHLFHSMPEALGWQGGSPKLEMPRTRELAVTDRHFLYKRPTTEALQFIFSLQAVQDPASGPGKFKMVMMLDAMVAVGNPNDVPLEIPPGFEMNYQLSLVPYALNWDIQKSRGGAVANSTEAPVLRLFKGTLEGRGGGRPAGFTLEPGEAAVFGSSSGRGHVLDLQRGFVPSGGVEVTSWDLRADDLSASDMVDFTFRRLREKNQYGWMQFNAWIGGREAGRGWQSDRITLNGGSLSGDLVDESLPEEIRPPQVRPVRDFIARPQPVLMLSFLQNVEQPSGGESPDAFPSRPHQLGETSTSDRNFNPSSLEEDRHAGQGLITAEGLNYQFRTLAAGDGGRNIYIGGGRQPNLGGSFNVIKRRLPISPPLSIAAFQHAIASGFCGRFSNAAGAVGGDPFPRSADALCGKPYATPLVSHAIGGSHGVPQVAMDQVFNSRAAGSEMKVATDHSWMVNTALWDAWFLSGMVDGSRVDASSWMKDGRAPREQFMDLAEGRKSLRNKRFIFHPSKDPEEAADALFSGPRLKDAAINLLPKYLLVDGAFNVNSTSVEAWAAVLASVREQQLLSPGGSSSSFDHPFGTLGYAASGATSGNDGDWMGLRSLSEDEIRSLAEEIVEQVKARGPFLSMADFVNRRPDSDVPEHQALGALQAAINKAGLNDNQSSGNRSASPSDFSSLEGSDLISAEISPSKAVGSRGYLSQADVLTALGAQITVRSDTFVVRAYGDARDPSGKVLAQAWCEAVVQRLPEYVNPVDSPEASQGWPSSADELHAVNSRFGRRFEIRSFRWISPEEV